MKARTILSAPLLFLLFFVIVIPVAAQSPSPQQTLNQYISDLQKNPNDNALREKIIKHVQTMSPPPSVPEEARRHYVMALTLFKGAKKIEDYSESIEEFKSALLIAPWWAEANRDLGMALEAAKRYDEAISALKLYITSGLGEEKMRAAQDEIYKIEAMKKLAAKEKVESSPQAIAAKKQNEFEQWFKRLDGARYQRPPKTGDCAGVVGVFLEIRGSTLAWGVIQRSNRCYPELPVGEFFALGSRYEIRGREVTARVPWGEGHYDATWIISEDKITESRRYSDGDVTDDIYRRVR